MPHKNSKYHALLIDTSTFENHGLKFDAGILADLAQFKQSPVEFLLPDIIRQEIESHLIKKTSQIKSDLLSKLKIAKEHLETEFEKSDIFLDHIKSIDCADVAKSKIHSFIEKTGAKLLISDDYISITNILDRYFSNLPPFQENGNKKNEFPDAIALITAEKWALNNKKNVLVVSSDKDWESYCSNSKRLTIQKNLSKALDLFNSLNAPHLFVEKLENFINKNNNSHIHKKVFEYLDKSQNNRLQIIAESHLDWSLEESTVSVKNFTLIPKVQIIRLDKKYITIELSANLELEIIARFQFTLGDYFEDDLKFFGSTTRTAYTSHTKRLLLKISNFLEKNPDELTIENIQSERYSDPVSVKFGEIEPN